MTRESIEECITESVQKYLNDLGGETATDVYEMVIRTVEKPLLEVVMRHAARNQSQAAVILGINRNTLRKKLGEHGLL